MTDSDMALWRDGFPLLRYHEVATSTITPCNTLRACKTYEQVRARKRMESAGMPAPTNKAAWNELFRSLLGPVLAGRLFPHQKSALARCLQLDGRILLAAVPGTGKTSMVICSLLLYKRNIKRQLIICPSIAVSAWCMELANWAGMDERDVQFITTTTLPKPSAKQMATATDASHMLPPPAKPRIDPRKRVIITTFAIATALAAELLDAQFDCVVVDESHALKNENSQRSKAIVSLMHQARYRIAMTGTPGDEIIQMYSILHAVRPDLFPSYQEFGERWCDTKVIKLGNGAVRHKFVAPKDKSRLDELNQILYAQVMFRVGKEVLKGLPPKLRVRKTLDAETEEDKVALQLKLKKLAKDGGIMSEQDSVMCDAMLSASDQLAESKRKSSKKRKQPESSSESSAATTTTTGTSETSLALASVSKKPRWAGGRPPKLDASGNVLPPGKLEIYGKMLQATLKLKLPFVMAQLRTLIDSGIHLKEKVLLFAHHDRMLNFMASVLEEQGLDYIRIDGKVTGVWRRGALCSKFQNDAKCRFAVLSIAACSTAITLTAASLVVFAEMVPKPSDMLQAGDRAHRIGQTKPVTAEYWILRGSLDETLYRILAAKEEQMDYVLKGPAAAATASASST
jgi:SNF2 family DNA or RNA helicase